MLNKVRKRFALIVRAHQHRLRLANGWKTLTAFAHRQCHTWKAWIRLMGAKLRPAAAEAAGNLRKTGARFVLSVRALWNRARREALPLIAAKGCAAFFAAQRWWRTQVQEAKAAAPAVLARAKAFGGQANGAADRFKADIPEMKRHIHRRAMAMTLAVMVTLSMFPAGAFAGEIDGKDSGADSGIPIITPIDDPGTGGVTGGGGAFHAAEWGTDENYNVGYGDLTSAVAYANSLSSGTAYIRLYEDKTLSESLVFGSGKNTVLNLNGHSISMIQVVGGTDQADRILTVKGNLTLEDTSSGGAGKITGGQGGGVLVDGGSFAMESGSITKNTADSGSGVLVKNFGSFTMNGGSITDNTASGNGGGVLASGTVTVGGTAKITGNHAGSGTNLPANNVCVVNMQTIGVSTETPLASGASIGVNTQTAPTDGNPVNITGTNESNVSKYFASDNNSYGIQNGVSNTVQLAAVPSCEARWGVAKADGSAPDNWAGTGTLNNAATYSYSITEGTAYIQLQSDVQTTAVLSFVINPTILDLNGKTINNTHSDFVLRVQNTLTLKDTSQDGGGKIIGGQSGVMVDGGNFTMSGGEISGNTGYGGVCVSSGDFTMAGGSITGNTASYGGGVSVSSGNFTMTGGSITGNTAPYGGGVGISGGNFIMTGGEISGNEADTCGGGVGISGGNFIMTGGEISGNEADTCGGGVYVYSGSLTVGGTAKITGNKKGTGNDAADSNVYLYTGVTISVSGSKPLASGASIGVNTEIAPTAGTPVNITGTNSIDISSYFNSDDNYCSIQNSATGNTVQLVAVPITEARWGAAGTGGTVPATWTNGTLSDALTYANGLSGGTAYIQLRKDVQTTATLKFATGKTTILDLNGKTIDGKNNTDGPVVYIEGNLTLTDTGSGGAGKITGGTAGLYESGNGGCVYVGSAYGSSTPGSFTMKGGVITGNDTSAKGDSSAGSGVFVNGGSFLMEGGSITGNIANSGGGVFVGNSGIFTMTGGSITGNTANAGGGVLMFDSATMTVGGTANISGNRTGTGADAAVNNVFLEQDSNSNQITISVSTSTPLASGASIGVTTSAAPTASVPVSVTGANANDVSGYFRSDDSKYSIQNSAAGNTVQLVLGAAPAAEARWGLAGTGGTPPATWTNGTLADALTYANGLSNGTAYIQLGKDVQTMETLNFATGKTTILDLNGKMIDAKQGSFSVLTVNGALTLKDTSSTDATKQGKITGGAPINPVDLPYAGGGVSVNATGSFTMDGGSIAGNTTAPGAGVYVNTGSFTMNGGSITGNDSGGFGGGVCVEHGSFTMNDGSITQNTAATGGGVAVTSGSFTMNGGSITGNTTNTEHVKGLGGGVALYTAACVMTGGEITGNSAGTLGGGVQVYSDSTITVSGTVKITGNTAFDSKIADNVYLYPKATISVSSSKPLASGSSIGVKVGTVPTAGTPVNITGTNNSDVSKYFLSDDSAYSIQNSAGNVVQLALGSAPAVWDGTSAQYFAGGTGTQADPYQIATAEQLCLLSSVINQYDYSNKSNPVSHNTVSSKVVAAQDAQTYDYLQTAYYKLTADIALNDTTSWKSWNAAAPANRWKPIGANYYTFKGYFDGNGKTVSGMYFNDPSDSDWNGASGGTHVGLFGKTAGATVENVTVAQSYVRGSGYVGGVVGGNDQSIYTGILTATNCHNLGTVSGSYDVGGVVGLSVHTLGGVISSCTNSGSVSGTNGVGGIVGDSQTVTNCQNSGTVSGVTTVGGVVGQSQGNVTNCRNTGAVSGTGSNIGGVVGGQYSPSVVSNCTSPKGLVTDATGDIGEWQTPSDTHQYIGHIIGYGSGGNGNSSGSISNGVSISPANATVAPGGTQVFTAKVGDGTGAQAVIWSLVNGDDTVSIDGTGKVTVGSGATNGKVYIVEAVSAADSSKVATAGVTVGKASSEPGTVWDGTSAQYFAGGTGTEADPYQIATAEQLCLLSAVINQFDYSDKSKPVSFGAGTRKVVEGQDAQTYDYLQKAYYKLTADIVLNDTANWESWDTAAPTNSWKPIGIYATQKDAQKLFKGTFDGGGKAVCGLYYYENEMTGDGSWNGVKGANFIGLFSYVTGEIKNVTLSNSYIMNGYYIGGIAGVNDGTITNCKTSGIVTGYLSVGGIAGSNDGTITGCQNSGTVQTGLQGAGGIAGANWNTIADCQNSGTVRTYQSSSANILGGIAGGNYFNVVFTATGEAVINSGVVRNCQNTGSISGPNSIGGIVAYNCDTCTVTGCSSAAGQVKDATGDIGAADKPDPNAGHIYLGNIIGKNENTSINGAAPAITTASLPGGTMGTAYSQTIAATGSTPMTWSLASGSLPGGLSLNASTGAISGTPTAAGTFNFTVKAQNSKGSASKALSITVTSPISSVSVTPSTATVKKTKTQHFSATVAGTASDKSVTWSVNSTKSSIDQNGLLTVGATETAATLTVKATSKVDGSKSGTATVTVTAAPKICTVTFDSDGGSAVSPIGGIEEDKTTVLPDAPTRDSYRFDGWFTAKNGGGTPFTAFTPVTDSITVYAKWTHLVTVAGTVVDYDNTPIQGASVTLKPTYGTSAATADAQGKFSFASIPEELFTVTAKFSDNSTVTVNVTGDYGNVKIVRPKPSISITTQPQDAMIVKGVAGQNAVFTIAGTRTPYIENSVAYQWYWLKGTSPDPLKDTKMDGSGSQMTFNADNGNIPSDPGTYRLYGYAYDSTANIESYSRIATLKVVGTNTVAGVVKKADGTLISGATVELKYADGTWPYGSVAMTSSTNPQTTGSDGAYRFETVPDGRYTLVITLPNGGKIVSGPYSFPGTNPPSHPTDPIDPGIVIPDAASIRINSQPQDATVKNGTLVSLKADASSTDGTILTYHWYSSSKNSNNGGTAIPDATGASYAPSTTNKGTTYYYCVVSGGTLAPVTTRAAKVTVFTYGVIQGTVQTKEKQPINGATVELINIDTPAQTGFTSSQNPQTTAADGKYKFADVPDGTYRLKITLPGSNAPIFVVNPINVPNVIPDLPVTPPDKAAISITSQPKNQTVVLNDTAKFNVGAGVSTGGTVLYQWYSNTVNSTSGGTAINGATSATYSAPTDTKGVTYYYCVMQATGADAVTSNIAKLTVRSTPLNNPMTIEGDVVNDGGSKVEKAEVSLSPKAGTSANPQTTGTNGHYKFENLPDGQYTVTVKLPGGGVVTKTIVIDDGKITPALPNNITVPADNSITITQQPTDIEATTDMTASFTVNATAAKAGVTYQWYRNAADSNSGGEKLDGKTDSALTLDKQPEGVSYYYCVVSSVGAADTATETGKLTVTKAPDNKGSLGGGIVSDDNGNPVKGATVKLMKNGTDGIQFGATVTTGDDGKFQFTNIPYGSYSLVAQKDVSTVTRQITIKSTSTTENLILPSGAKITKVVITGSDTPSAAVGNLEAMFDDADSVIAQQPGATVEIKLVVEKQDSPSDKGDIVAALGENQYVGVYLNAKLVKTISGTASDDGTEEIQPTAGQTLHIVLDIPKELQGKTAYQILRSHTENGVTDVSTIDPEYDRDLQTLSFDADAFSTYAVAYTQAPKYSVTVLGSQSVNSGTGLYEAGDTVTVQAGTRGGYTFTGWTSKDGVTFANAGSATTTFSMPAQNVTVTANWRSNGGSGNGGNGGGNGSGNGGTSSGDNNDPGGNSNPNPNPNTNPAPNPNGGNTKPGGNNNHGGTGNHEGGTTNHGGSTSNQGGGSSNGGNTNAGGTASGNNNGTGGKTTSESNNSSSNPENDATKLNAAKDSALQKLAEERQKAVDALPQTLTDEQRKKALDEIDRIYSVAIKNIQNAESAEAIDGITDQTSHDFANVAAGAGSAKPAQAPAGAAAPKPFILFSAVLAAAAIPFAALAWRRRENAEVSQGSHSSRIIASALAAAAILLFLLTTGWQGVAVADLWTIAVAVLAAGSLVFALKKK